MAVFVSPFLLGGFIMYQKLDGTESKSRTRLYNIWKMMRKRCRCKSRLDYKYYGGRGIKVCPEWDAPDGYDSFKDWSLSNGYKDYLTIDRINVDGNYSPDNCRWVTMRAQADNRRNRKVESQFPVNVVTLTYKGETMTLSGWSKRLGISVYTLRKRFKSGWKTKDIIETPIMKQYQRRKKS